MAEKLGEAVLVLDTRDNKFTKGVKKAGSIVVKLERKLADVGRRVSKVGKSFQKFGKNLTLGVTAPLTALSAAFVVAADKQIQAEARLGAAISASGGDVAKALPQFKAFAERIQSLTIIGDEVTLVMGQVGLSMGLTEEQARRASKNAIGLAAAFGINAASAIRYTAALEEGDTTMLNRYIPTLRLIKDNNDRVAAAQRILGDSFKVAIAQAKAGLGPFRQFKNSLGDLFEQFGTLILKAINPFISKMRDIVDRLQALSPEIKTNILLWGGIAAAIGPILIVLGTLIGVIGFAIGGLAKLRLAFLFLFSSIFLIPLGIASVVATLVIFKDTIVNFAKNLIGSLKKELIAGFNNVVVRPFQKLVNVLIASLPSFTTLAFNVEPVTISDVIDNSFTDDFKSTFEQAKKDATEELDDLKRNAKKAMADISSLFSLPDVKPTLDIPPPPKVQSGTLSEIVVTAKKLPVILAKTTIETDKLDNAFAQMGATFTSAFEDAILNGKKFSNVLGGLLKDIARLILRAAVLDPLSKAISAGVTGLFTSGSSGGFVGPPDPGPPGKVHGGRVQAGQDVIVGEKRREVFRPDSSGRIIPSVERGGGVVLNIDASGADASVLANLMGLVEARIIPQAIEGARSAVFSDLGRPEFA